MYPLHPAFSCSAHFSSYQTMRLDTILIASLCLEAMAYMPSKPPREPRSSSWRRTHRQVLRTPLSTTTTSSSTGGNSSSSSQNQRSQQQRVKRKYKRKRIPMSELEIKNIKENRQQEYEEIIQQQVTTDIWSFESLFPEPVWDEESIEQDLYKKSDKKNEKSPTKKEYTKLKSGFYGGSSMLRVWREPKLSSAFVPVATDESVDIPQNPINQISSAAANITKVDRDLTRMVEDRIYGYRRMQNGDFQYEISLMSDGAVQFRDGVRLGNPLSVNADRLNYFAKTELQQRRVEEAQEYYDLAMQIDPRDGRAYLGMSRCAERRRDFKLARAWLQAGIKNAVSVRSDGTPDRGANPFLLQALGCLEEKMGRLSEAEALYTSAVKSRPSHAAAWVSLAQLRTEKLGQTAAAGRKCLQLAEQELLKIGKKPPAHVYTTWGSIEYKKAGDVRRARELFKTAIDIDKRCSVAWLQLGSLETDNENWDAAEECFETALKFDKRNSRLLQAYAVMESKRPDSNSRKAIELFERALNANRRDAGVLQAYALYVVELGDIDSARDLLERGTRVNKRHAPVWQAWGVLETLHGSPEEARRIFQQGIWSCAQLNGSHSGGYHCARLWQAWGVLETKEGDSAAARRCFSRALDADSRNIAAITAWALLEESLDNTNDARIIFEEGLRKFATGSSEKNSLWRSYEQMERRVGGVEAASRIYQRAIRETMAIAEDNGPDITFRTSRERESTIPKSEKEIEVVRWNGGSMKGEVWMTDDKAIESKVPFDMKKRKNR